jgi:uncharacterized protein (TIGR03435 family)
MKKLLLALLISSCAFAQDLAGTWQGTLSAGGKELRTVFKVESTPAGLKTTMFSIDQGTQPFAAGETSLRTRQVKIVIPAIGGTYTGELSADARTITGNWSQGPGSFPLTLVRAAPQAAWAIPEPSIPKRMAASASPGVEVATIKPSQPGRPGKIFTVQGQRFVTANTTAADLISFAYSVQQKQLSGGPVWLDSDKFDLAVQPDTEGMPNQNQLKVMLQKVLADRFQLAFHREKRELSVYAIVAAKSGAKLTDTAAAPGDLPGLFFRGLGDLVVRNATLADLANLMQSAVLDRPVVDQSGLTGRYDFTLRWTPDQTQFLGMGVPIPQPAADDPNAPPDLFSAAERQLGLRFESTKAPADVLVIDKVSRPSEN